MSQCWACVNCIIRALRLVLFGFFTVSASVGALIAVTQVIGALGGARNALPLEDVAQSLGIDLAAAGTFAFFLRRDLQVRACAATCISCVHPAALLAGARFSDFLGHIYMCWDLTYS